MVLFIISIAFLIISVGWFLLGPSEINFNNSYPSKPLSVKKPVGFVLLFFAIILLGLSMFVAVQPKQVGVVTNFGRISDTTLSAGPHIKAPWSKVTQIDATVQTDEYHGDSCITVVLADKNTACVSATNRWAVDKENAHNVFADFRSSDPTESLRDAVVSTQFKAAVNDVFGSYDATQEDKPDYAGMARQIEDKMVAATGGLIDMESVNDSVTISYIKPSDKLQAKIENIQAQEAKTRIAEEALATAKKQAEANKALSDSISNDPNVLVAQCIEGLLEGSITNQPGFSCWPGGGSGVVIPGVTD